MAAYSIFVLGESQLTISNGDILDGVSQGDGSHLVDGINDDPPVFTTITLNSNNWQEIAIDDDDSNFRDNDGNQRLDGAQDVDGTVFADGTVVEAEYSITVTDGTTEYTMLAFNVRNSSPSYATVEGLAFIGGPGGFPPINQPLTVIGAAEGPNFQAAEYATPICYAAGTLIRSVSGDIPVEHLNPGDLVATADNGFLPITWCDRRLVLPVGRFAPIRIPAGCLGATQDTLVSQQHRVLVGGPEVELLFGEAEVFVTAKSLVDAGIASTAKPAHLTYCHIGFAGHEVIRANGIASESYFDGGDAFRKLFQPGPDISVGAGHLARRALRQHEAHVLLSRLRTKRRLAQYQLVA
ncbi:MAG: Hint domain-containing protein [Pseudomonadota bacterium]